MENYQVICSLFFLTLRQTRQYDDLQSLRHVEEGSERYVVAEFSNGAIRKITVTSDICIAMIKDILKQL